MLEALICKKQYVENHCDPENVVPALERRCLEWSKCFNKDFNSAYYNSSIGAETLGQVLNSLIEPIGIKALVVGAIGLALWVFVPASLFGMLVLALASGLQLKRWLGWRPWMTKNRPVLWILHAAYAWFPVGLALLALAQIGIVTVSAGVHALAVGATGGLIIGMVTRTARGHTGRPIQASKLEVLAYILVMLAAVLRVFLPLVSPELLMLSLVAAATAWSVAFMLYLWVFTPWLIRTRLDGKDG